jgi:hypothetical protein
MSLIIYIVTVIEYGMRWAGHVARGGSEGMKELGRRTREFSWGVKLATRLQLLPRSRILGSVHPLPHTSSVLRWILK